MISAFVDGVRRQARRFSQSLLFHPQNQEDRNERLLYLNTAMYGVVAGGIMAFLPIFLARLGASSTLVGWLTSGPSLVAVFFLIPGAVISERSPDQVKVRVRFVMFVLATYLLCALAPSFVPARYLAVALVLIWALKTLAEAIAIPAWTAVVATAVSPRRRAQLNGTRWAIMSLVSALSSAFFGWLLDQIAFPLNYQVVFFISFFLAGLDPFFFARIRVPPLAPPTLTQSRNLVKRVRGYIQPALSYKPFLVYLGATLLYRVALNLPVPLFSLYWVNELQAPDTLIGLRGTIGYGALVVGYMLWGRSANKLGHRRVLFISALGLALYPLLTGLSHSSAWLLPVALIWGLTASGVDVALFDLMLGACPQERQPLFAALWAIAANLAAFAGPLLGASLSNVTGLAGALIIGAAIQVLTVLPFIALPKDD